MTSRVSFAAALLAMLLLLGSAFGPYGQAQERVTPPSAAHSHATLNRLPRLNRPMSRTDWIRWG